MRPSTGVRGLPALRRVNLTLRCGSWRALCGQWCEIRMLRAALAQRWRASRLLHVSCGHLHRGLVSRSRHHSWGGQSSVLVQRRGRTERRRWVPELDFCPVSSPANSQARWLGCTNRTVGPWRTLRARGATWQGKKCSPALSRPLNTRGRPPTNAPTPLGAARHHTRRP